ncbi:MAG: PAS domain S-box protein [Rhodocyclaceae bacterium]|nr:PAS domain S-box protein [Rhodocyclaceae bacterium]
MAKPAAASRWLLLLPRMAFALFVAAVVALLMMSDRAEKEEQRAILISDVLWLEQNLRFQLTRHEEVLGQIGPHQAASAGLFEAHAKTLMASKTGLRQVIWLDAEGRIRQNYPGPTDAYMVGEVQDVVPSRETMRLAKSLGRPAYSAPYPIIDDDWQFEVHVPVFRDGQLAGVAIGAYSIRRILDESIPWWLAERYRISVIDTAGSTLGTRSKVAATEDVSSYQIPFEPPGHGLSLQATPYRTPTPLAGRLLSSALVFLALLVLWSLWALRRHMQQRLAAEEALRNEYAFRKAMEDSLQTGLRARDPEGRITYVNPAFCRMVGWSAEELLGRAPPMPYWPDEYLDETRNIHDSILAGQGPEDGFELKFKRRNGELFDVFIHEAPLIDARGRHTGWMGSLIDVTERKRAEELAHQQRERLQATARLVTMGEMASSLAHELNQPLAAIASYNTGCLNMLDSGTADSAELKLALTKSAEQAQRAGRIIRRIYQFVRRAEPKSEPCDLAEIIDEVLGLVDADARRQGVRIVREVAPQLPVIQGDRVLIAQALLNLVRNAIEAMRNMPGEQRQLTVAAHTTIDGIAIAISDMGCGISSETATRLFEPFYTTKTEGMGMGLNICRSVIEAHHGRLWYEANPQGGSIFRIQFPVQTP